VPFPRWYPAFWYLLALACEPFDHRLAATWLAAAAFYYVLGCTLYRAEDPVPSRFRRAWWR
jgi:hypothetical protein